MATCLSSLAARYLQAWPADEWNDAQDEVDAADELMPVPPLPLGTNGSLRWSEQLLPALLDCVAPLAADALAAADASPTASAEASARARRLVIGFLLRALEFAQPSSSGGSLDASTRALAALCKCEPRIGEFEARISMIESGSAAVARGRRSRTRHRVAASTARRPATTPAAAGEPRGQRGCAGRGVAELVAPPRRRSLRARVHPATPAGE